MTAIRSKLQLATRELQTLVDVPGDWRAHAGRIVSRSRVALQKANCVREAVVLLPLCDSADPSEAIEALSEVVARINTPR
jgi:hypothetical protein